MAGKMTDERRISPIFYFTYGWSNSASRIFFPEYS